MEPVYDYLNKLTNAPSIEILWPMHCEKMAEFGFDRLLYGFSHYTLPNNLGNPDDFYVLTNHKSEYIDGFVKEGLYHNAPMTRWAMENEGFCSWRWMQERLIAGEFTAQELKVIEFNRSHGAHCGYTISFKSVSQRARGAIALTGRADLDQDHIDNVWAEYKDTIILMNNILHLKLLSLPYTPQSGRRLTARQREALEWVGDGKTTQDIALLMGLTAATVEKHLRLARETLNVETTAQAVLKAAFQNQMFVIDDN